MAMLLSQWCRSLRELRKRSRLEEFYRYQEYLQRGQREDEEMLNMRQHLQMQQREHENDSRARWDKWLAWTSLAVNIVMLISKSVASYFSNSMSIISTLVDSVMDITSGTVVYACVRLVRKTDRYEYPIGRNRLEPLTILIVSVIMVMANIVVIGEAALSTIQHTLNPVMDVPTAAIMVFGTALKLVLYILCRRHYSPNSRILALDQRNDIATNIVATTTACIGNHYWIYADPLGAFLVCSYIALSWLNSARQQIPLLIGKAAKPEFMNRITKIALNHDNRIRFIDTIYVYHLGSKFLVELHVVMDNDMTLQEAHDISEPLQLKLERLPYVERAFVHCDYNFDGAEHI